jgi:hypothetical protein
LVSQALQRISQLCTTCFPLPDIGAHEQLGATVSDTS